MDSLLLHICCGPCSLYCIDSLKEEFDGTITGYFANPNIHPYDEWMRRKGSARAACEAKKIPLFVEESYQFAEWANFKSSHAERCKMCYTVRAALTAQKAAELNCKYFTSTLFVSPYQNHELMKELFEQAGREQVSRFSIVISGRGSARDSFRRGKPGFTVKSIAAV